MTCKLSLATLQEAAATAAIPAYDPKSLSVGIVHFGVGNFHRAHQAIYLDDLFNAGQDHDWAIIGAGVLPSERCHARKACRAEFPDDGGRAGQQSHRCACYGADDRHPAGRRRQDDHR